jgi:nucleoside-diphosphate-sugar epimerase
MSRRLPDIAKIKRLIGYQPSMDLPAMLEKIIAYYRQTLAQPAAFGRSALVV